MDRARRDWLVRWIERGLVVLGSSCLIWGRRHRDACRHLSRRAKRAIPELWLLDRHHAQLSGRGVDAEPRSVEVLTVERGRHE